MLSVPTLWLVFVVNFVALGLIWTYVMRSYPNFAAAPLWTASAFIAAFGAAGRTVEERDGKYFYNGEQVSRLLGKMGKSLKNAVTPDEICAEYGADTLLASGYNDVLRRPSLEAQVAEGLHHRGGGAPRRDEHHQRIGLCVLDTLQVRREVR